MESDGSRPVHQHLKSEVDRLAELVSVLRTQLQLALPLGGSVPAASLGGPMHPCPYIQTRVPLFSTTASSFVELTRAYIHGLKKEAGYVQYVWAPASGWDRAKGHWAAIERTGWSGPALTRMRRLVCATARTCWKIRRRRRRSRWLWSPRCGAPSPLWMRTTTAISSASIGRPSRRSSAASSPCRRRPCRPAGSGTLRSRERGSVRRFGPKARGDVALSGPPVLPSHFP